LVGASRSILFSAKHSQIHCDFDLRFELSKTSSRMPDEQAKFSDRLTPMTFGYVAWN
jgi:hypothetical protein